MTHISDLFSQQALRESLRDGYVTERHHPSLPLRILSYTKKAQYEQHWDEVTMACRGLIVDLHGDIIARPFPKFFNQNETLAPHIGPNEWVRVYDKLDGSLGILYPDPAMRHGYAVATRGSFVSEQATWATQWLNDQPEMPWGIGNDLYLHPEDYTPLVEIIYPANRIVLDYDGYEGLIYLGEIGVHSGDFIFETCEWDGRTAEILYTGYYSGWTLEDRVNAEGAVVYSDTTGKRFKQKQDDYLALHRIVTGLNERSVFEALRDDTWDNLVSAIPEEFGEWATSTAVSLVEEYLEFSHQYSALLTELLTHFSIPFEDMTLVPRRDLAQYVNAHPAWLPWQKAMLFLDLDNKPTTQLLWKQVELNMKERNKNEQ